MITTELLRIGMSARLSVRLIRIQDSDVVVKRKSSSQPQVDTEGWVKVIVAEILAAVAELPRG